MLKDRFAAHRSERGRQSIRWLCAPTLLVGSVPLLSLSVPGTVWGQEVPPHEEYRTLETPNFRVTFPIQLEEEGRGAAVIAENAYAALLGSFLPSPSGQIDLLLTDHSDVAGGFTQVFPSNRIVISAQPPLEGLALSHFDDWMELVITHELVHIFQLDRAGPLATSFRWVLGRAPWSWPTFPGYTTSDLGIEGVAVHLESVHTAAGRVHGSFNAAIARTQALGARSESVGQALGRSPQWPAGDRPYAFGSLFFRYLSETYGEPAVVQFFEAMASQWIPYRLDAAARDSFGHSFQELWTEWIEEVEGEALEVRRRVEDGGAARPALLTDGGRLALYPAPVPSGPDVAYIRSDGRSDLRLVLSTAAGERTLTRWNSLDPPRWLPDGTLLLPQVEHIDR